MAPWDRLLLSNDEFFRPIHEIVSQLRTRGENIRRRSISPLPSSLEISTLEYHAHVRSHVATMSGIPIQNVVSGNPIQPSIPTLLVQTLLFIPSSPTNPMIGGKPPKQVVSTTRWTNLKIGQSVYLGNMIVSAPSMTTNVVIPSSVSRQRSWV